MAAVRPDFDFEARLPLIQKLDELNKEQPVPVSYWAMVWMSDFESLQAYVEDMKRNPIYQVPYTDVSTVSHFYSSIIKPWTGKERARIDISSCSTPAASTPTTSPAQKRVKSNPMPSSPLASSPVIGSVTPTKTLRDSKLTAQVHERDNGCVITKIGHPKNVQIAHIYPVSMSKHIDDPIRKNTWEYLRMFYSKAEVDSWRDTLLQSGKTEVLENLISMSHSVHTAWDSCQFALFPISPSSVGVNEIQVRFYYLKVREGSHKNIIRLSQIPDLPSDCRTGLGGIRFFNCVTLQVIEPGDIITLRTPDPIKYPLPSVELLRMQWHLNRIGALVGGAEAIDDDIDDDDDDDEENLGDSVNIVQDELVDVGDEFELGPPASPSQKAIGQLPRPLSHHTASTCRFA